MKKLFLILTAAAIFAACGPKTTNTPTPEATPETEQTVPETEEQPAPEVEETETSEIQ